MMVRVVGGLRLGWVLASTEEFSDRPCHDGSAAYRRGRVRHDAVFEENTGDELGACADDVRAPDFWCFHD